MKPKGGGPMEALNPTEVERLMAAEGYTDHCNLSTAQRLGVLAAWRELALADNCGAAAPIGRACVTPAWHGIATV